MCYEQKKIYIYKSIYNLVLLRINQLESEREVIGLCFYKDGSANLRQRS